MLDPDVESPSYGRLDTGNGTSMIDSAVLNSQEKWQQRKFVRKPVEIIGKNDVTYKSWEMVVLKVYLPDESGRKLAAIEREFHVVDDLDGQLVIGTDIISLESMVINLAQRKLYLGSCGNLTCLLQLPRGQMTHVVRAAATITIKARSSARVPIRYKSLPPRQKSLFTPYPSHLYLPKFTYVLRKNFTDKESTIVVTNVDDIPVTIEKGTRVGQIAGVEMGIFDPYLRSSTKGRTDLCRSSRLAR